MAAASHCCLSNLVLLEGKYSVNSRLALPNSPLEDCCMVLASRNEAGAPLLLFVQPA